MKTIVATLLLDQNYSLEYLDVRWADFLRLMDTDKQKKTFYQLINIEEFGPDYFFLGGPYKNYLNPLLRK